MKLQKKPNRWSCLITAFAMVLDMDVHDLIKLVGHDGSTIMWPDLPEPQCRRAWHPQEIINAIWKLGFSTTVFENRLITAPMPGVTPFQMYFDLNDYIQTTAGVAGVNGHALAYQNNELFDPDTGRRCINTYTINTLWVIKSESRTY